MSYTMEDFNRQCIKERFARLTPEEQREALTRLSPERRRDVLTRLSLEHHRDVLRSLPAAERREFLRSLPPEELLGGLSAEQIREYLAQRTRGEPAQPRKPRRKR